MYQIVLVDDELDTLHEIAQAMDWQACGFVLAGIASSGEEALQQIEQLHPDLICTDIRMPQMDGFELIERAHALDPHLAFLIISGYDEFGYAQQAVRSAVLDFLLKPVSADTLRRSLLGIRERLDDQRALYKDLSALRRQLDEGRSLLRTSFLTELLSRQVDPDYLREHAIETLQMTDRPLQIRVLHLDPNRSHAALGKDYEGRPDIAWQAIRNAVREEFPEVAASDILFYRESLVFYVFEPGRAEVTRADDRLSLAIRQRLGLTVRIGVSAVTDSLLGAREAYTQAIRALGNPWLNNENSVYRYADLKLAATPPKIQADWSAIEEVIIAGDPGDLERTILQIGHQMAASPIGAQELIAIQLELGSRLLRLAAVYGVELEAGVAHLASQELLRDPATWARTYLGWAQQISAGIRDKNTRTADRLMAEASRYIEDHLADPALSLEQISAHLGISPSHFTALFRAAHGRSFLQQVISRRLEQACHLLTATLLKASDISTRVGFASPSHFTYCFRKHLGLTPVEYRRRGEAGGEAGGGTGGEAVGEASEGASERAGHDIGPAGASPE